MTRVEAELAWVVVWRGKASLLAGGGLRWWWRECWGWGTEGDGSRECWGEESPGLATVLGERSPKPALSFSASPELFVDGGGTAGGGRKGEAPLEWGENVDLGPGSTLGLGSLGRCWCGLGRDGLIRSGVALGVAPANEDGGAGGPRGGGM